ncbi:MAG: thioredoxin-disulfide reductase [Thermodesulfobacteriota bacterium]|nr:thioredoxin-disulfide reductase [Thermodesulfobacteriota bacterium]
MDGSSFDLIIIGGGPAGLTAGLYAARARLNTRLLEKLSPGGQVLNTDRVDNYPGFPEGLSGFDLVDRMREQAERFGLEIAGKEVTAIRREGDLIDIILADGQVSTKALIVASGAQPVKLGVPGELELTGKGVSYCATCDGPFYRDVEVGLVGGGDMAVEEALFLTKFASRVHLFHRRDELRATGILREKIIAEPKVKIHWSTVLTSINADDQGMVSGLTYKDVKTGAEADLPVAGVFMFVGQNPTTGFLQGFVDMDERGFIKTDSDMAASQPGVWAAGDVRVKKLRQISTAVGDGATAAFCAEKYIEDKFG